MTPNWIPSAIFYHIYPLGLCDAPSRNDHQSAPVERLNVLHTWLDHLQSLGVNAIYLGPVFEASSHGYDTADYYQVDRRLGTNNTLVRLSQALHERGIRLVLDAVFNHVGRNFWAFQDVQQHGANSAYVDWFHDLRFDGHSSYGDPFQYQGWNGHASLVKLNLTNPDVRAHLFDAVRGWVDYYHIDGLRLDAADCLDMDFLQHLARFTRGLKDDFWLMGEIIHGDYTRWANAETLHSTTNYEAFKGLYSSLNDGNYFEIAYTLNRQFGEGGLYRNLHLYNFADNHDVNRVASLINHPAHLFPLYTLLFTIPGVPSLYYGSEWAITGEKAGGDDSPMRPSLDLAMISASAPHPELMDHISTLTTIRNKSAALQFGSYRQLDVRSEQFAFLRENDPSSILVALNASTQSAEFDLSLPGGVKKSYDLLHQEEITIRESRITFSVPPFRGRIIELETT